MSVMSLWSCQMFSLAIPSSEECVGVRIFMSLFMWLSSPRYNSYGHCSADMPGRGGKSGPGLRPMKKPFKPKQQKKRFIRVKDPIISVLMWGVQHSVSDSKLSCKDEQRAVYNNL